MADGLRGAWSEANDIDIDVPKSMSHYTAFEKLDEVLHGESMRTPPSLSLSAHVCVYMCVCVCVCVCVASLALRVRVCVREWVWNNCVQHLSFILSLSRTVSIRI